MSILSKETEEELTERVLALVEISIAKNEERNKQRQRYLRIPEAVVYCGVSRATLDRWVIKYGLKRFTRDQIVLYDRKDLDEFIIKYKI
ncbi:AlpA family transcriptional regulator [Marinilactibacillus sp. Marseille-P9653]|uniref:helix-turn-helix transcriptional regulator n=1 Tax=Marinilactibacillus sp. Marseille-P9653 TaxID=2866583 RepID=UPI001CE488CA|nr:helix-turn-helix domain-containing protein [Marinilactibacillus sp. Marseille-P9653]